MDGFKLTEDRIARAKIIATAVGHSEATLHVMLLDDLLHAHEVIRELNDTLECAIRLRIGNHLITAINDGWQCVHVTEQDEWPAWTMHDTQAAAIARAKDLNDA